jgi:hypothetical protein
MSTQHATEPAPVTAGLSRREIHHARIASPTTTLWQKLHGSPTHPVALTVTTMAVGILAGIGAGAALGL